MPAAFPTVAAMKSFHVVDVNPQGEVRATQAYDYATLERIPGCSELIGRFSGQLYQWPEGFELPLTTGAEAITFRWRASAATAGIATVRAGPQLASLSILATGSCPTPMRSRCTRFSDT
jgi:hypothetical protein